MRDDTRDRAIRETGQYIRETGHGARELRELNGCERRHERRRNRRDGAIWEYERWHNTRDNTTQETAWYERRRETTQYKRRRDTRDGVIREMAQYERWRNTRDGAWETTRHRAWGTTWRVALAEGWCFLIGKRWKETGHGAWENGRKIERMGCERTTARKNQGLHLFRWKRRKISDMLVNVHEWNIDHSLKCSSPSRGPTQTSADMCRPVVSAVRWPSLAASWELSIFEWEFELIVVRRLTTMSSNRILPDNDTVQPVWPVTGRNWFFSGLQNLANVRQLQPVLVKSEATTTEVRLQPFTVRLSCRSFCGSATGL